MGFLNNSGDIILDAVLTDIGRARLAKGDGSFKIAKFALADDEIDYSLYNPAAASGQQDLQILQSPILESFTNAFSSLKSKLLTVNLQDILYLPVLVVNTLAPDGVAFDNTFSPNQGFTVAVDSSTETYISATSTKFNSNNLKGYLFGYTTNSSALIRIDQGINNSGQVTIPEELVETQYFIEIDNRLGYITDALHNILTPVFIDEDDVATYLLTTTTNVESVKMNEVKTTDVNGSANQVIAGGRGTILKFGVSATQDLQSSNFLFTSIGSVDTTTRTPSANTLRKIPSNITVYGGTTGFSLEIPVNFLKYGT
jgi:hypothetical protein